MPQDPEVVDSGLRELSADPFALTNFSASEPYSFFRGNATRALNFLNGSASLLFWYVLPKYEATPISAVTISNYLMKYLWE
jgi:hypothetical protein